MPKWLEKWIDWKQMASYIFFGIGTSVINFGVYFLLSDLLHISYLVAEIVSWFFAVGFAFVTNRRYVFVDHTRGIWKEIFLFYGGRAGTLLIEYVILLVSVELLGLDDTAPKLVATVVVIVVNYFWSKFFIFRSPDANPKKDKPRR